MRCGTTSFKEGASVRVTNILISVYAHFLFQLTNPCYYLFYSPCNATNQEFSLTLIYLWVAYDRGFGLGQYLLSYIWGLNRDDFDQSRELEQVETVLEVCMEVLCRPFVDLRGSWMMVSFSLI